MKERLKCPMCGRRWTVYDRSRDSTMCPICDSKERQRKKKENAEKRRAAWHNASYWWAED